MHQDKYYGNYVGIVVQNDDPEQGGKVKVFVPHISPTSYVKWFTIPTDKQFKFIGLNLASDLSLIIDDLKDILPWAQTAMPISGEDAPGRYHALTDIGTISDSSTNTDIEGFAINEKPALRGQEQIERDDFGNVAFNTNAYSNTAKGTFAIPSVGAKVWVFFEEGDPHYPVVFAVAHSADSWKSAIEPTNYPAGYENSGIGIFPTPTPDNSKYRSKVAITHKGGSIEFVNTDGQEKIVIGHRSGSFKEFGNTKDVEVHSFDNIKLTKGDEVTTVRNDEKTSVGGSTIKKVKGDVCESIGENTRDLMKAWKGIFTPVHEANRNFAFQRTGANGIFTASSQIKAGTNAPCIPCHLPGISNNSIFAKSTVTVATTAADLADTFVTVVYKPSTAPAVFPPPATCPSCNFTGVSPSSDGGVFAPSPLHASVPALISSAAAAAAPLEAKMGKGGSKVINVSKDFVVNVGKVSNDFVPYRIDTTGKYVNSDSLIDIKGGYIGKAAVPLCEYVIPIQLPGGTYTINAGNSFNVNAGAAGITLKTSGNADLSGGITSVSGHQVNINAGLEVNVVGKKHVLIESEVLRLRSTSDHQVFVDSNLGVAGNATVTRSLYVNDELVVNHISAPIEIQQTQQSEVFATPLPMSKIGTVFLTFVYNSDGAITKVLPAAPGAGEPFPLYGVGADVDSIKCAKHSHHFANVPLKLYASNDLLRDHFADLKDQMKTEQNSVKHENKQASII